eukprot:3765429-Prymnesium_polylepis.1
MFSRTVFEFGNLTSGGSRLRPTKINVRLFLFREHVDVFNLVEEALFALHRLAVSIKPQPLVRNGMTVAEHDLAILHRVDVLPVAWVLNWVVAIYVFVARHAFLSLVKGVVHDPVNQEHAFEASVFE